MRSVLSNLGLIVVELSIAAVLLFGALAGCFGCFPARPMKGIPAVSTQSVIPPAKGSNPQVEGLASKVETPATTPATKPAVPPTVPALGRDTPPTQPATAPVVVSGKLFYVTIQDSTGATIARYSVPAGTTIQWPAGSKLLPAAAVSEWRKP